MLAAVFVIRVDRDPPLSLCKVEHFHFADVRGATNLV